MRRRDRLLVIALALLAPAAAYAQSMGLGAGTPDVAMVYPRGGATSPGLDFIFSAGSYYQSGVSACVSAATCLTATRTTTNGSATDLLPASASGQLITTFANNTARVSSAAGGLIVETATVNQLLNATAPATQTTASLATATYTLWVNGSGSATMSAGTGTGCGTGAATQGTPVNFTITVAGTCTITVAGSLNAFQLEAGAFGTSLCTSGASACSRGADVVLAATVPSFANAYSFFTNGVPESPVTNAANQVVLQLSDGTTSNRVGPTRNAVNSFPFVGMVIAGVAQTSTSSAVTWSQNASLKLAGSLIAGAQNFAVGGAAQTPTTTSPILAGAVITVVTFGARSDNTLQFNGVLSRVSLWPTVALTSAQLQALTK